MTRTVEDGIFLDSYVHNMATKMRLNHATGDLSEADKDVSEMLSANNDDVKHEDKIKYYLERLRIAKDIVKDRESALVFLIFTKWF